MGARVFAVVAVAIALSSVLPAVSAGNAWGFRVDAVVFSRFFAGVGPSPGANAGAVGDAVGADTRVMAPGASEFSVRAFVESARGDAVAGVKVAGVAVVAGATRPLVFRETSALDGAVVYDADRSRYPGGSVAVIVTFDFDRDGNVDDDRQVTYRAAP